MSQLMSKQLNLNSDSLMEISYDDKLIKKFVVATLIWGVVAFLLGLLIALELANYRFNLNLPWITFGRLRPLHTNAAIFAFAGNAIFAGIYYSLQRLCKARLFSNLLGNMHFWGWQLIIVSAALTILTGHTTGKEYAELEWPIDIAITLVWVFFAINTFGTIFQRKEKHIYVAIWFYMATILTVAVLHIINSIEIPVSFLKSYSIYSGVQDALIQWWYGHNAVAFFLTTPFLGLMYYFVPKAVNRPVYSYRLSIIHFWSLVFIYIWAGPHHLLYTATPEWLQTLGMIFSVSLWAPSWGGMINGLLTLRGAWSRVREEPILKFMVSALTFYGMSTFEGPLLSIKSVNELAHYTDWIIGHVHSGTIGWNYFLITGILFYMVPKLWKTKIYSNQLGNVQFWTGTIGLVLYIVSMWISGITQGLMWKGIDAASGNLIYPNFMETVIQIVPMYYVRAFGGFLVFVSFIVMLYNFYKTIKLAPANQEDEKALVPKSMLNHDEHKQVEPGTKVYKHRKLEGLPAVMAVLIVIAVLIGSLFEILPSIMANNFIPKNENVKPYSALEIAGRDIYIREGCYTCHSQMVRPTDYEKLRYGRASSPDEFIYDHPFQWGSRRIGPDLHRIGRKYNDLWHYKHMIDPRTVVPESIMPSYSWLENDKTDFDILPRKLKALKTIGVPYSEEEVTAAKENAMMQAQQIAQGLTETGNIDPSAQDKEIVALIAYLQRLGTDIGANDEYLGHE